MGCRTGVWPNGKIYIAVGVCTSICLGAKQYRPRNPVVAQRLNRTRQKNPHIRRNALIKMGHIFRGTTS